MDKSLRLERFNPLSRESLLAAELKSVQCGNMLDCLMGHCTLKYTLKGNVILSMSVHSLST